MTLRPRTFEISPWTMRLIVLGVWTLPGLSQVAQEQHYALTVQHSTLPWWPLVGWAIPKWWVWVFLTPVVVFLARRFPIGPGGGWRNVPLHIVASVIVGGAHMMWLAYFNSTWKLSPAAPDLSIMLRNQLWSQLPHLEIVGYWGTLGVVHMIDTARALHERELRSARLETELARAELGALRMQLHPHFLFNTLNAISVLMADDVARARRMLHQLSALLRGALSRSGVDVVTLGDEIESIRHYLSIEAVRFEDRLVADFDVDPHTVRLSVPNLLLQPIVENAIRHGLSGSSARGHLSVRSQLNGKNLLLTVEDDGAGVDATVPWGVGLTNTRDRLALMFGEEHRLNIAAGNGRGTRVEITIPAREIIDA